MDDKSFEQPQADLSGLFITRCFFVLIRSLVYYRIFSKCSHPKQTGVARGKLSIPRAA